MYRNYLKVAARNLLKSKSFTVINILGLALGLMVAILVFLFVKKETSYEKHFADYQQIYRTSIYGNMNGQEMETPASPSPLAYSFRSEFPEVVTATRIQPVRQEIMMQHEETKIYIDNGFQVDSQFFQVFSHQFIHGDPATALTDLNTVVLTESTARKFFGDRNPMGEIINYDTRQDYVITGVVKDPKPESHFHANMYFSNNVVDHRWLSNNFYTYVKLKKGQNLASFRTKLNEFLQIKIAPELDKFMQVTPEEFLAAGNVFEYNLTPIQRIHLYSNMNWEIEQNGSIMYVYIFVAIAFLVLLIAGINFMNLSTARSAKRAKEVGIRKVSGATQPMLIGQFLLESILQSAIALFVAFVMVELFLPAFNHTMNTNIELFNDYFGMTIGFALLVALLYGIFSGSYPAFFLSSFQPIKVLKGDVSKSKGGALFRKTLVVLQFTASVVLIIAMIVIFKQTSYMHNKNLGFKGEQVLVVPLQTDDVTNNFRTYQDRFLKNSNVLGITRSSYVPGDAPNQNMYRLEGRKDNMPLWNMEVDYDFFETLNIQLADGRDFNRSLDHDSSLTVILNETAVKSFNIENPIGAKIDMDLGNFKSEPHYATVVGIVKDFHIEGFDKPIRPMIFSIGDYIWFASIRIRPENMQETINFIEKTWNEMEPSHPFTYTFLDERFGVFYEQQDAFSRMFLYLTILAIIISCMGLYGLASYTTEQRTKEIGVRKVLGASIPQLMTMLSIDFIKLVIIANLFAWPIAFILTRNWLSNFTYQIDMPYLPFIMATFIAILIALLTISYQAFTAAVSDPVKALKYE
ncbi:MAG: ABC transporter permease [Chitinophagales bacterium]